jgi:hypothetical protein
LNGYLSDPALKGHYILAQGNALGEDLTTISALKGRYINFLAVAYSYIVTPLQGSIIFVTYSQGVALGWYVTALQASKPCRLPIDLILFALSQIEFFSFLRPSGRS